MLDPHTYDGRPVCPRCGSGWPCCADLRPDGTPWSHTETCALYRWAGILCAPCSRAVAA